MKPFFVYMLECSDLSLYVGHTDDLEARLVQHDTGAFRGHTSARRPVRLVWRQEVPTREEALRFELQLKGWSRAKKRALIDGDWGRIRVLSRSRSRPGHVERDGAGVRESVRPEPVEGRVDEWSCFDKLSTNGSGGAVGTRETGEHASPPVRPEPVEGRDGGRTEKSVRPELVEGRQSGSTWSCFDGVRTPQLDELGMRGGRNG